MLGWQIPNNLQSDLRNHGWSHKHWHITLQKSKLELHPMCLGNKTWWLWLSWSQWIATQGPEKVHKSCIMLSGQMFEIRLWKYHEGLSRYRKDSCDDAGDGGKIAILPFVCHESCIRILQHIIIAKQRWRSEFTNCIHKKIISTIYTLYIYCFRYLSYLFRTRNERKSVPESEILKM